MRYIFKFVKLVLGIWSRDNLKPVSELLLIFKETNLILIILYEYQTAQSLNPQNGSFRFIQGLFLDCNWLLPGNLVSDDFQWSHVVSAYWLHSCQQSQSTITTRRSLTGEANNIGHLTTVPYFAPGADVDVPRHKPSSQTPPGGSSTPTNLLTCVPQQDDRCYYTSKTGLESWRCPSGLRMPQIQIWSRRFTLSKTLFGFMISIICRWF